MRTVVHLSDIHFGRVNDALVEPLLGLVSEIRPDIVAVSGDLTQRARTSQFKEARAFLDRLPSPQIVVPGNHDIPLFNLAARFGSPLKKYRRYITADLQPFYADDEMAVIGINTARSLTRKDGRISRPQVASVVAKLSGLPSGLIKIIVTHHPFDVPAGHTGHDIIGRAKVAMKAFARCGADIFLSGHLHVSHSGPSAQRYGIVGHSALIVQAGTTVSTRGRGEANAFNVIRLQWPQISVQCFEWEPRSGTFAGAWLAEYRHTPEGWAPLNAPAAIAIGSSPSVQPIINARIATPNGEVDV